MSKALGVSISADAVTNVTSYSAHSSGATAVVSAGATDLDTTAAQVELLTTKVNSLLSSLRASGLIDS